MDLVTMKAEIDALQIAATDKGKPWYRQASVIIALAAVLLSFGSTLYSYRQAKEAKLHDAKVELRDLIQKITSYPIQDSELRREFAEDAGAYTQASGLVNAASRVVTKEAMDVAGELHSQVSSTEYKAIAVGLEQTGLLEQAIGFETKAMRSANNADDWASAARGIGLDAFAIGDLARGRRAFRTAMEAYARFPTRSADARRIEDGLTELRWAAAELGREQCSEAKRQLDTTDRLLGSVSSFAVGGVVDSYKQQSSQLRRLYNKRCRP